MRIAFEDRDIGGAGRLFQPCGLALLGGALGPAGAKMADRGMRGGGYSRSYSRGGGGYSRGATRMYASPMVMFRVEIERCADAIRADVMETARTSTTRFPRR